MGQSFRVEDLLGQTPMPKKAAGKPADGFSVEELLAPEQPAPVAPAPTPAERQAPVETPTYDRFGEERKKPTIIQPTAIVTRNPMEPAEAPKAHVLPPVVIRGEGKARPRGLATAIAQTLSQTQAGVDTPPPAHFDPVQHAAVRASLAARAETGDPDAVATLAQYDKQYAESQYLRNVSPVRTLVDEAMLGLTRDPQEQAIRKSLREDVRSGRAVTPEELRAKGYIGETENVNVSPGPTNVQQVAAMAGSLAPFVAIESAAGEGARGIAAAIRAGDNAGAVARGIARVVEYPFTPAVATTDIGEALAGVAKGAVSGQVGGAALSAAQAAENDENVADAIKAGVVPYAMMGAGFGALHAPLGTRIEVNQMAQGAARAERAKLDNARALEGKLPLSDQNPEAQYRGIAAALQALLEQKEAATPRVEQPPVSRPPTREELTNFAINAGTGTYHPPSASGVRWNEPVPPPVDDFGQPLNQPLIERFDMAKNMERIQAEQAATAQAQAEAAAQPPQPPTVTSEGIPGRLARPRLPEVANAPVPVREAYTRARVEAWQEHAMPEVLDHLGISPEAVTVEHGAGTWEGRGNPNVQVTLPPDASPAQVRGLAAALGHGLEQDAVPWVKLDPNGSTFGVVAKLAKDISTADVDAIAKTLPEGINFTKAGDHLLFSNFTDLPDEQFAQAVTDALDRAPDTIREALSKELNPVRTSGELLGGEYGTGRQWSDIFEESAKALSDRPDSRPIPSHLLDRLHHRLARSYETIDRKTRATINKIGGERVVAGAAGAAGLAGAATAKEDTKEGDAQRMAALAMLGLTTGRQFRELAPLPEGVKLFRDRVPLDQNPEAAWRERLIQKEGWQGHFNRVADAFIEKWGDLYPDAQKHAADLVYRVRKYGTEEPPFIRSPLRNINNAYRKIERAAIRAKATGKLQADVPLRQLFKELREDVYEVTNSKIESGQWGRSEYGARRDLMEQNHPALANYNDVRAEGLRLAGHPEQPVLPAGETLSEVKYVDPERLDVPMPEEVPEKLQPIAASYHAAVDQRSFIERWLSDVQGGLKEVEFDDANTTQLRDMLAKQEQRIVDLRTHFDQARAEMPTLREKLDKWQPQNEKIAALAKQIALMSGVVAAAKYMDENGMDKGTGTLLLGAGTLLSHGEAKERGPSWMKLVERSGDLVKKYGMPVFTGMVATGIAAEAARADDRDRTGDIISPDHLVDAGLLAAGVLVVKKGARGADGYEYFEHRSPIKGIKTLDARYMGTGRPGAETSRPRRPKMLHVQDIGTKVEPQFLKDNVYYVRVPKGKVYDASKDPDGIVAKLIKVYGGTPEFPDRMERAIGRAGYLGYRVSEGAAPEYVKLFGQHEALPPEQVPLPGKAKRAREREFVTAYSNPVGPAIDMVKRAPTAASLAVLGVVASQVDNDKNISDAGPWLIGLAALNAIGTKRLSAAGNMLGRDVVEQLTRSDFGKKTVRFVAPRALIPEETKIALETLRRTRAFGKAKGAELSAEAQKLGPSKDRQVSDVIEGEDWEGLNGNNTVDVIETAMNYQQHLEELTKRKIESGVLAPESALPNHFTRRYAEWDVLDVYGDRLTGGGRGTADEKIRIGQQKRRTLDIPIREAEARLQEAQASGDPAAVTAAQEALDAAQYHQLGERLRLGEIREASYRVRNQMEQGYADVAAAEFFKHARSVPGTIHPEFEAHLNDFLAAKELRDAATTEPDFNEAQQLMDQAKVQMDKITRRYQVKGGDWAVIPDTRSMGVLRGMVVKREIANEMNALPNMIATSKLMHAWKEIHTVFNIGTNVANVAANIPLVMLGGLDPIHLLPALKNAVKDIRSYGRGTRDLTEIGMLGENMVTAQAESVGKLAAKSDEGMRELVKTTRPETAAVMRERSLDPNKQVPLVDRKVLTDYPGLKQAKKFADWQRRLYNNEDNIYRVALYNHLRDVKKMGKEEAIAQVYRSLGDFRRASPALRLTANTVSPFIRWSAQTLPGVAANIVEHPYRWIGISAFLAGLDEIAKHEVGAIPERDLDERDRRVAGYFFPGFTQLPYVDEQGQKMAVDLARWNPSSSATDIAQRGSTARAIFGSRFPRILSPSGPLFDIADIAVANRNTFTDRPRFRESMSKGRKLSTALEAAATLGLPSALSYHVPNVLTDLVNNDVTRAENDALGLLGMRPRPIKPGQASFFSALDEQKTIDDIRRELRSEVRKAKNNPERIKELRRAAAEEIRRAQQMGHAFRNPEE